jgi:P4 family phage/plasmid primase-like protien
VTDQGPYGQTAELYWRKAWGPFPVKGKHEAIPRGVTGLAAKDPDWGQIQGWLDKRPFSNVAVLANGWVSIDVDEGGQAALDKAQEDLGQLPATWSSTSWGPDSPRRQHFYRVPVGFSARLAEGRFRKAYGDHVDIIHRKHRYAIVAPSIHPDTGAAYRWYTPAGVWAERRLPHRMEDLAEMPQGWLDFLAYRQEAEAPAVAASDDEDGFYDSAESSHGWTEVAARAEVDRMLERIRTVDSNVNTQAGGAMREVGRFVPALMTMDHAVSLCRDALVANPWHDDGWNVANGKDWTAATLAATAVARGGEDPRSIVAADEAPEPQDETERYTDAFMSARLVREELAGRFIYTTALGWLKWDGTRWAEVVDEIVHEAGRQWTLRGYGQALAAYRAAVMAGADPGPMSDDPDIRGWAALQGHGRISSVVKLARGIESVFRDASDFDQDEHLLNTPSGVVDLRTGLPMPHDSSRMITKITSAGYVPGADSVALKKALEALPADVPDWLQLMLGEAVTGHSGERMVLLTGGGRNGKTVLMGSIYRALGGYAAKVPNTLLLRTRQAGAATPERMTLRGIRFAYMEETPEDGYLDANVVKDLLDAEMIDGRHLYRDSTSWVPTHSIFLNTNHPPTITDTGEGAWRRMARVDFPYRYRKVSEALENESDRRGDPGLKAALGRTVEGQTALLAWLVAGAVRYYAAGSIEEAGTTPASVEASVRKWRADSDDILRFMDETMDFDLDSWVAAADLYREFVAFQKAHGQMALSAKAFTARIEGHSALPGSIGRGSWLKGREGLSRPGLMTDGYAVPLPERVKGWNGLRFKIDQQAFELEE